MTMVLDSILLGFSQINNSLSTNVGSSTPELILSIISVDILFNAHLNNELPHGCGLFPNIIISPSDHFSIKSKLIPFHLSLK